MACLVALAVAPAAHAAFPGQNGKIAYVHADDIWSVDPDGTDAVQLTGASAKESGPAWSPDGKRIAFVSTRDDPAPATCTQCRWDIYVMDADGTDVQRVTNIGGFEKGLWPAWSPDGTRLAYSRNQHLWTVALDGTDVRRVTNAPDNPECFHVFTGPVAWSPDGTELVDNGYDACYDHDYPASAFVLVATGVVRGGWSPYGETIEDWSPDSHNVVIGTDGGGWGSQYGLFRLHTRTWQTTNLTPPETAVDGLDGNAAWSPDGATIVFRRYLSSPQEVYLIDAATGANERPLGGPHIGCCYDWQPIPVNAYPRPKGASPTDVSLVPAYEPCSSANRTHGPPLGFPSCNPPVQRPGQLTVGTPDANGQPAKSNANLRINPLRGDPATPADEADVRLRANITDVRLRSDLSDYTGSLEVRLSLQITDKDNTPHPGGPGPATVQQFTHSHPLHCAATADTTVGSTCGFDTTLEALVPGAVKELQRAIWELGAIRVHDGAGNLFMTQGVFVP